MAALAPPSGPALGHRRNHAKGICFTGVFESNGNGAALSRASVFARGQHPALGRFKSGYVAVRHCRPSRGLICSPGSVRCETSRYRAVLSDLIFDAVEMDWLAGAGGIRTSRIRTRVSTAVHPPPGTRGSQISSGVAAEAVSVGCNPFWDSSARRASSCGVPPTSAPGKDPRFCP